MLRKDSFSFKRVTAGHLLATCLLKHPASLTSYTHLYFYISTSTGSGGFCYLVSSLSSETRNKLLTVSRTLVTRCCFLLLCSSVCLSVSSSFSSADPYPESLYVACTHCGCWRHFNISLRSFHYFILHFEIVTQQSADT